MVRQDPHAGLLQRIQYCLGEPLPPKRASDIRMREQVHRAADAQFGKSLSADPVCLALVDDRDRAALGGVSDRCGLTVVEGVRCAPDDKFLKGLSGQIAQRHYLDETGGDELAQQIRVRVCRGGSLPANSADTASTASSGFGRAEGSPPRSRLQSG